MARRPCAAVVLAGGRSRRMGGGLKALEELHGQPMLAHVIERLRGQVDALYLSVESYQRSLESFGLQQLPDPIPGHAGPLGGVLAGLHQACDDGFEELLLTPCDAPFLPLDLCQALNRCLLPATEGIAVVRYAGRVQPTFSLWRTRLAPVLHAAVMEQGLSGLKQFFDREPAVWLDWPEQEPSPFFNINDRIALQQASRRFAEPEEAQSC